eukprot:4307-Heterococcus_DN1.PRE.1
MAALSLLTLQLASAVQLAFVLLTELQQPASSARKAAHACVVHCCHCRSLVMICRPVRCQEAALVPRH